MGTTPRHLLPLSLSVAFAACSSGAEPAPPSAPMPIGEVAPPAAVHQDWSDVTPVQKIDLDWVDAAGTRTRMVFGLTYRTRMAQELLAAECVRANWTVATECAQRVCAKFDWKSEASLRQCERDLQQQLGEALFPCDNGAPLATISKITWDRRLRN